MVAAQRRSHRGKGGCPPFDLVVKFKILILQALCSLSDQATEFQIKDRLSFQRFLGLETDGMVPVRRRCGCPGAPSLVQAKAIDRFFARSVAALTDRG